MRVLAGLTALAAVTWASPCACASTRRRSAGAAATADAGVSVLHEFAFPSWVENLAVRSNGQILAARLDAPAVYQVDPSTGDAVLVHAWDAASYKGALGIAETTTDQFYVITSAFVDDDFDKTSGVNAVWHLNLTAFDSDSASNNIATHLVDVPEADFLNGMTALDDHRLLVSDVHRGIVFRIDTLTADHAIVLDDNLMKYTYADPNTATHLGSNGLKIFENYLYWSNTAAGLIARVPIDADASPHGAASVAVTNVPKADDFLIRSDGTIFVAQNQMDTLSVAYLDAAKAVVAKPIFGSNTSTILAGVTAAKFGRRSSDCSRLYLSTSGGLALPINGTVTVPGTISYIDASVF